MVWRVRGHNPGVVGAVAADAYSEAKAVVTSDKEADASAVKDQNDCEIDG